MYAGSRGQKLISLSSCKSELHSLISRACDSLFIKACAVFVLDGQLGHIVYTDSSSARQLACRQGSGKVRHLSGKLLWIQGKTADGSFQLRQVRAACNIADIGTKTLGRHRLFYFFFFLNVDWSRVYITTDFTRVGADEFLVQNDKLVNSKQLKQITKAILRMSIVMGITGGLEPAGPFGAMAQQCDVVTEEPKHNAWWMFTLVFFWDLRGCAVFKTCVENMEMA